MPKAKTKSVSRRRLSDTELSEDESVASTSVTGQQQRAASQVDRAFSQLAVEDREQISNDIVRYLLSADQRKLPIKRADITKNVVKENGRAFSSLMAQAAEKLRSVFGIELVEIESGANKQKAYILVNALDNKYDEPHQTWPDEDNIRMGLIMTILSVIFMRGNVVCEDELYDMLRRLGVNTDGPDETFGDVRRLLTQDFVRIGYLDVEREQGDPPTHSYRWGPRAKAETSKRHVMDFICQVFGEESTQRWIVQMQDIEQSEQSESATDMPQVNGSQRKSTTGASGHK